MTSLFSLIRLQLRTTRGFLAAWLIPQWLLVAIFPLAYQDYYPTLESRQEMLSALATNAGTTALYGHIAEPGTVGQVTTWQVASWLGVLGSVMAIQLSTRLHRRAEHNGLGELVRSTGIKRSTMLSATFLTTTIASVALGLGSTLVLLSLQPWLDELYWQGALAFGITVTLMCLGSVLIAELVQLFISDGSALTRVGLSTLMVTFIARAIADVDNIDWLNWVSPLGWRMHIAPYADDNWAVAGVLAGVVLIGAAVLAWLNSHRNFDSGLVPPRSRETDNVRPITGPVSLSASLQAPTIGAWVVTVAILAAFLMSVSGSIQELVAEDIGGEFFRDVLGGSAAYEAFIGFIGMICGILITVAAVALIFTHVTAEQDGTIDMVRSTGVRRWMPLAALLLVTIVAFVIWVAVAHGAGAVGLWSQEETATEDYATLAWSIWSQLGAILFFTGLALCVVGFVPRGTMVVWIAIAFAAVAALMGEMLGFPEWLIDLSPFDYTLTSEDSDANPVIGMAVVGTVLAVIGVWAGGRRQVP